jgi:hypothetical protein
MTQPDKPAGMKSTKPPAVAKPMKSYMMKEISDCFAMIEMDSEGLYRIRESGQSLQSLQAAPTRASSTQACGIPSSPAEKGCIQ